MRCRGWGALVGAVMGAVACKPSQLLTVPPPSGQIPLTTLRGQSGAEQLLATGAFNVFDGLDYYNSDNVIYLSQEDDGVLYYAGLLTDELTWANKSRPYGGANIDARLTSGGTTYGESGDLPLGTITQARVTLTLAIPMLKQFEPASGRSLIGEAYALTGYVELFLAEDYCAGVPLSAVTPGGGVQYGAPLTSDSLLGVAEADFDSAVAYAAGVDSVANLAGVGLGRTRLDRGRYAAAAAAVASVPTGYVYNVQMQANGTTAPHATNQYETALLIGAPWWNVSDREVGSGLNFVSAGDPRLVLDSTLSVNGSPLATADGGVVYYPVKFGTQTATLIPLATGVEARLVEAEAALQRGDVPGWTASLNGLRAAAPSTYLALSTPLTPLTTDSTTGASSAMQVDVMFRERAFWLYGLGTRLGDLRRLVRQYGRDPSTVYPSGTYLPGLLFSPPLPTYGTDVALTLPTPASGTTNSNPNYHGCLNHSA